MPRAEARNIGNAAFLCIAEWRPDSLNVMILGMNNNRFHAGLLEKCKVRLRLPLDSVIVGYNGYADLALLNVIKLTAAKGQDVSGKDL